MCLSYPFFINNLNLYNFYFVSFLLKNLILGEAFLKRVIHGNIRLLATMNSYRGDRLRRYLPSRGQRTRTNVGTLKRFKKKKLYDL